MAAANDVLSETALERAADAIQLAVAVASALGVAMEGIGQLQQDIKALSDALQQSLEIIRDERSGLDS